MSNVEKITEILTQNNIYYKTWKNERIYLNGLTNTDCNRYKSSKLFSTNWFNWGDNTYEFRGHSEAERQYNFYSYSLWNRDNSAYYDIKTGEWVNLDKKIDKLKNDASELGTKILSILVQLNSI